MNNIFYAYSTISNPLKLMKNKTIVGAFATVNADVSRFNLGWSPLLYLPDNNMIDQDLNDTLLNINMSVKPKNPESHLCVLVAFTCLHLCTSTNIYENMSKIYDSGTKY
jgi:hypothetical protein